MRYQTFKMMAEGAQSFIQKHSKAHDQTLTDTLRAYLSLGLSVSACFTRTQASHPRSVAPLGSFASGLPRRNVLTVRIAICDADETG